jgi:hypothetical protein
MGMAMFSARESLSAVNSKKSKSIKSGIVGRRFRFLIPKQQAQDQFVNRLQCTNPTPERFTVSQPRVWLRQSMENSRPKSRQRRATTTERITFIIRAENKADILASIVLLFQRLNVEIEALYMVRPRRSETMQINVTIEANREVADRMDANLCELVNVRSVKMERPTEEVSGETFDDKSRDRYQR